MLNAKIKTKQKNIIKYLVFDCENLGKVGINNLY